MTDHSEFYFRDPAAPPPNKPRRMGVIALIERDGTLLLERRVDAPLWSLIAGTVGDAESLADALRREVHEETGLRVSNYELFGTFSDPTRIVRYPDGNVVRVASFAYRVAVESFDALRPSPESEELRFFPPSELLTLDVPATHRHIIQRYVSGERYPHLE